MRGTVYDPVVILKPERVKMHETARVDSFTKIEGGNGVRICADVHIASFCHVNIGGGFTVLEKGASMGSGAKIISGSNVHGYDRSCSAVAPDAEFKRSVVIIRKNATLFAGAIVLPGVIVGENAVVAAGAVVTKSIPPFEIWAGVPARKIGVVEPEQQLELPFDIHDQRAVSKRYLDSVRELQGEQ